MEVENSDSSGKGLGDPCHHFELLRSRQPIHADGLFRGFETGIVDTFLDVWKKLRHILDLIDRNRRRIIRKEEAGIFPRQLLDIRNIQGDEAPLRFRDHAEKGCLADLPCTCNQQCGEKAVRFQKWCFKVSSDVHCRLHLC